jgi:hypothetical protein
MAFLIGSAAFDVAAAVGLAVPTIVAGYLLVAGLATGILAAGDMADVPSHVRIVGATRACREKSWTARCGLQPIASAANCSRLFTRRKQGPS